MNLSRFWVIKRSRWFRRFALAVLVFVLYCLFGFFVLPPVVRWQLVKRLPDITKRHAAIRQVRVNPLTLSLTIRGLELTEPDGRPFASWEEFYVNFQSSSLFRWAWTFKEVRLVKPFGEIRLFKGGRLNFANMFDSPTNAPPPAPQPPGHIPRVNIFHLLITNGFVALEDQTRRSPFRTEYRPINLELTRFTTQPNSDTPYSFRAESDAGRSVTWAGDLTVQPLRSQGRLEVTGVKLSRYQPYLEDFTKALLTNGLADLRLSYRFELGTNGLDLAVTNGSLHVEQVQLLDPDTSETVAGLRGFDVQQGELNWRDHTARLGTVSVSEAVLLARLEKTGKLNLLRLLTLPAASTNAPGTATNSTVGEPLAWTVGMDDFTMQNTAVVFEDLTHRSPFRTEIKPLSISLKHLTTRADSDADYSFRLVTEAAETLEGFGKFSVNPARSSGEVKLASLQVKKYLPYAEDVFRGQITSGQLAATVPYHVELLTNQLGGGVTNLTLQLTNLEVKAPAGDETVTRLAGLELNGVEASLAERRARVGSLRANGGALLARREADGALNLLGLLVPGRTNNEAPVAAVPGAETNAWAVSIDEIALSDYHVQLEDRQLPNPGKVVLDNLALDLKGLSTALSNAVTVSVATRLNDTGTLAAQGSVRIVPQSADFTVALTNLDLRPLQPWLDQFLRLGIVSGAVGTQGHLVYQSASTTEPRIWFTGSMALSNFLCTDQAGFEELARWQNLAVSGIDCTVQPTRLKVEEVDWLAPKTTVLIGTNRVVNLAGVLRQNAVERTNAPALPAQTSGSSTSSSAAIPIQVGIVKLGRASFAFIDQSIQPHANIGVQELNGTVKGLSSALNTTADVDLAGKVDEQSPFSVVGRVNPWASNIFVDLIISNANTQLTPLTPYMEKFAGHPLNKGRLSTVLRYHVEGNELKAENKVDIDHLTLGPRNKSPDATSLPVKLAVALLKDSNGRIELNLPVHGRIDDPQFSVGPIILKVLVNAITKAVASPFKLLGALVGGGEELSFVAFSPGTTNLVEGEADKLTKLAKALAQRPALNLEIEGAIDPVADREALAKQKLHHDLKARRLQELTAKGKAPQSVQEFDLPPEDYDRLLRAAFAEKFGTNIAAILQTNQLALASTNSAAVKPAAKPKLPLYRRALVLVGFGQHAKRSAAEKHLPKAARLALQQATPELMETLLATQIQVADDDYRALMNDRARWVQNWLLQNGSVANDRLLLVAPKPVDDAYQGESQAKLSLD